MITEEDEEKNQLKLKNSEFIFLIDRSGSMGGIPIQLAVKALKVFLHSLPLGCFVNVYSFGSDFEALFEKSMEYTQDSLEIASAVASKFEADMGGTEIYEPLKNIFSQDPLFINGVPRERQIFLLTDGAVSNTRYVVDLVRQNTGKVHTFGIGRGVSTELVKEAAMAGKGHYFFIDNMQDIDRKVLECL